MQFREENDQRLIAISVDLDYIPGVAELGETGQSLLGSLSHDCSGLGCQWPCAQPVY